MSWFKRNPTEDELERSILYAAMLARAQERDTKQNSSDGKIRKLLAQVFKEIGVRLSRSERKISMVGVQALLMEGSFINEALDYRLENGGAPMPVSFRAKMLRAMQSTVDDLETNKPRT